MFFETMARLIMPIQPGIHMTYPDFLDYGMHPSRCGITTITSNGNILIIFSDLNNGISVTNAIDQIATEVYSQQYSHVLLDHFFVIEHYGHLSESEYIREHKNEKGIPLRDYVFDLVSLSWNGTSFSQPNWRRISLGDVKDILLKGNIDSQSGISKRVGS